MSVSTDLRLPASVQSPHGTLCILPSHRVRRKEGVPINVWKALARQASRKLTAEEIEIRRRKSRQAMEDRLVDGLVPLVILEGAQGRLAP